MVRAEKDTAGPIGKGTRFRSAVRSAGRIAEMVIETTEYDRPRLLASTTTMEQMEIEYTLTFEPVDEGTRMRWSGEVRPKGGRRLLGPLVGWMGTRQERRMWSRSKESSGKRASRRPVVDGEVTPRFATANAIPKHPHLPRSARAS